MPDLLIELFSEEIPARMQAKAAEDLKRLMTDALVEAGLTYASAAAFATPRRLALTVEGVPAETRPQREERKGPRADAPDKAVEGFLRSTGLTREQLEVRADKKGDVLFAVMERPGRPAAALVAEALEAAIRGFPWPKSMRWGEGSLRWVRPLRSILAILHDEAGREIVPLEVDGFAAADRTWGHRFMAPAEIVVGSFEDYRAKLRGAFVMLDAQERAETIRHDADQLAFAQGLEVVEDRGLLAEIAGLVEWPVTLMGPIEDRFLELPPEVLQTSMKEHQKFLSVRDPASGKIVKWVTVANRETADDGAAILAGNAKVLAARLSDALFFWENDLRTVRESGLEGLGASLSNVTFHSKLGSEADRIARISVLAKALAPQVGASAEAAAQGARVCKADLASEMVYEFPELQGVMGRYYAAAEGLDPQVAATCEEHYRPLGPSDDLPEAPAATAAALADKLDMLAGFWSIDETPTGSKDPFALRRAALGVVRILLDGGLRLRLREALDRAFAGHGGAAEGVADDLLRFFGDRLKQHLRAEGVRHDVVEAGFRLPGQDDLTGLAARVRALQAFVETEDGGALLAGYRRAANILTAEEKKDGVEYSLDPDPKFAEGPEETALFAALDAAEAALAPAVEAEDFAAAMAALARLRGPVDAFFEAVVVNADNPILRRNRLCLLHRIRAATLKVADLSALEG
ncbi:MAG: glycine--tRNA ligase subunit beta [Pseudomonadota bacterium]